MLQRRNKTEINIKETKNFKRRKNIKEEREKLKSKHIIIVVTYTRQDKWRKMYAITWRVYLEKGEVRADDN